MRAFLKILLVAITVSTVIAMVALRPRHGSLAIANPNEQNKLVVHEWGTFTSIAGKDGVALEWRPLNGSSDLPSFVHTIKNAGAGRHGPTKDTLAAKIRMETPVLYFYSNRETEVSVKVDFPKGRITEWYPQARGVEGGIEWGRIKVLPGASFNLPAGFEHNHYYTARETDAAPIQVCGTNSQKNEQEKFLFYRGVGSFGLPLSAKLNEDQVVLKNSGTNQIARLIIFENRGGKIGYQILNGLGGEQTVARPALDRNLDSLIADLTQSLVDAGLYQKEAEAMVKTWRKSWFEAGLRVFYLLPRETTDEVLPLHLDPAPDQLVRVLVGRAEIITPEMERSMRQQVGKLADPSPAVRAEAMAEIRKHGRFSEPILKQVLAGERDARVRGRLRQLMSGEL